MHKYLAVLGLAHAVLLTGCSDNTPLDDISELDNVKKAVSVKTDIIERKAFTPELSLVGTIQAAEEILLSAEVVAPVKAILVREGQKIQRGDLLLELETEKLKLALSKEKHNLEQSQSLLLEKTDNLNRRKELAAQKTISQELLDTAKHEWQRAKAAVADAEASVQLAKRNLYDCQIISPVNGVVDKQLVEIGESVQIGQNLLQLQATDQLEVKTWISERDIHAISEGNSAEIKVANWPDKRFSATVHSVGIAGDRRTGNFPVTLLMDSHIKHGFRPGMTATVNILGMSDSTSVLIPETALFDYQRQRVVYVLVEGKAQLRKPVLQVGLNDQVKVLSGLAIGEEIIIHASQPLYDGATVTKR